MAPAAPAAPAPATGSADVPVFSEPEAALMTSVAWVWDMPE